ncbi:unnamed protein product [Arabis nemorensis]|uniref:Uncharacterized protein n=1 Tax=Arabis nemorensis TaxID=586526 RepID=A0A565BPZ0_9BRAS|nr:unnamed protein product [Arabis nemorensis]
MTVVRLCRKDQPPEVGKSLVPSYFAGRRGKRGLESTAVKELHLDSSSGGGKATAAVQIGEYMAFVARSNLSSEPRARKRSPLLN